MGIERAGVKDHPYFIKTSFPTPGSESGEQVDVHASAEAFARIVENAEIPEDILIVFLSGGHSPETSRLLLQEMAKMRKKVVGSSFSRANLEEPYKEAFKNGAVDFSAGQEAIRWEGIKNKMAMAREYTPELEKVPAQEGIANWLERRKK